MEQQGMHNDAMILGGPLSMAQSHHDIGYHHHQHGGDGPCVNNTNNNQLYSQGMNYANSSHNNIVRRMGQGKHTYRIVYHGIWGLKKVCDIWFNVSFCMDCIWMINLYMACLLF